MYGDALVAEVEAALAVRRHLGAEAAEGGAAQPLQQLDRRRRIGAQRLRAGAGVAAGETWVLVAQWVARLSTRPDCQLFPLGGPRSKFGCPHQTMVNFGPIDPCLG